MISQATLNRGPRSAHRRTGLLTVLLVSLLTLAASLVSAGPAHADTNRVEITNIRSGLKADVMWASTADFTGVFLWPNNTSASQEFNLLDSGGGWFRIQARHSGKCLMLDWRGGTYTNGTRVIQYNYCGAGYAPAEWRRGWVSYPPKCDGNVCSTTGTSYPILINRRTGRCLDSANGTSNPPRQQAILQQWDCISSPGAWNAGNQLWGIAAPGSSEGYL